MVKHGHGEPHAKDAKKKKKTIFLFFLCDLRALGVRIFPALRSEFTGQGRAPRNRLWNRFVGHWGMVKHGQKEPHAKDAKKKRETVQYILLCALRALGVRIFQALRSEFTGQGREPRSWLWNRFVGHWAWLNMAKECLTQRTRRRKRRRSFYFPLRPSRPWREDFPGLELRIYGPGPGTEKLATSGRWSEATPQCGVV
jgi:hypothetical protein